MSRKLHRQTRERHSRLLTLIDNGTTAVADLAAALQISESTVRRDLEHLQETHKVARTYGGARSAPTFREYSIGEAAQRAARAKSAIADAALRCLPRAGTIFLDAGTTCAALARRIAADPDYHLHIATRGLESALTLADAPHVDILLLGGTLRRMSHALIGALTLSSLERLHFDACFLGADAVCPRRGIGEPTLEETAVKESAARRSSQVFVLADAGKLNVVPPPPAWTKLDPGWTLITDPGGKNRLHDVGHCCVIYSAAP